MDCPLCQSANPDAAKFCNECGYNFREARKPAPDAYPDPRSYTPKHLAEMILTTRGAIEGERKVVTVFFGDVVNYTAMAEKLDPEAVHHIMDGCFQILMQEIHQHEGTINQFTGDGVMALFGAPLAHEKHAHSACSAALAVQKSINAYGQHLREKFGVTFSMRIGLNSGPVVVGSIGDDLRMDYTAIGDTTNLAARMESLAKPGATLVSKHTYQKVRHDFDFEPLGSFTIKGKEYSHEAYLLKRQRDRAGVGFTRQIYSEMVGRQRDLNRLELQVSKVINGEGSIVNVIGEAGIGKSRLVAELKYRQIMKDVALLEGRAISIGKGLSFYPIIGIFKNWAKIKTQDSDSTVVRKLEYSIRQVTSEGVDEILPFILTMMGVKLTGRYAERVQGIEGDALEKLILKSVKDLLIKSSEMIPLVIVFDDLHWIDLSTAELLGSMFRLVENQRILFINVFRPRYTETDSRITRIVKERFSQYYVEIELQALNEHLSEMLIYNMLSSSHLPYTVKNRIIRRAGGNPFFIEEVVRSFIDSGAIVRKPDGFMVTKIIDSAVIPHTINDLIVARIDRLEENTRELLKVASVIGRSFFYRILSEILKHIKDIDDRLQYLKELQLIRERVRMEELEYLFKHALIHEAAYESLLFEKRKRLHIEVGRAIENVFSRKLNQFYGMLAYHYSKGEHHDKAEAFMIKAGEEALKSSASWEALTYYQEALSLYQKKYGATGDIEKLTMLEKNIALVFYNKGNYAAALEYFDRVLAYLGEKRTYRKIAVAAELFRNFIGFIATLYLPTKKEKLVPDEKVKDFLNLYHKRSIILVYLDNKRLFVEHLKALRMVKKYDLANIPNGILMWLSTSGLFSWSGVSFGIARKMLLYTQHIIDPNNFKDLLYYKFFESLYHCFSGRWHDVRKYDDDLVQQNLKVGELWHSSAYITVHCLIKIEQGAADEVRYFARKLAEMGEDYDYDLSRGANYFINLKQMIKTRKLDDALAVANEAIAFQHKRGEELRIINLLGLKAMAEIRLKDMEGARETLLEAREISSRKGREVPFFTNNYLMAAFLFDLMQLEQKCLHPDRSNISKYRKTAYRSGLSVLKNYNKYAPDRTEAARLMGIYYWLVDRQRKAVKCWEKSLRDGEALGAKFELSRTCMEIGRRLSDEKSKYKELNGIKAGVYLDMAGRMFADMNLHWDQNELKRIVAGR